MRAAGHGVRTDSLRVTEEIFVPLSQEQILDADAGLVYVTDVAAAGAGVQGVDFPEAAQASTNYPIVVTADAPQPELAAKFQQLATGEVGRTTLEAAGFGAP